MRKLLGCTLPSSRTLRLSFLKSSISRVQATARLSALGVKQAQLPNKAEVVVAGGGVVGCSIGYHLGKLGVSDVVVLEQGSIGCGTTWHAAGLIGTLKESLNNTLIASYARRLYAELEEETGFGTGFKRCGSLTVAETKDRSVHLRRLADKAKHSGITCHVLSPDEAKEYWPLLEVRDLELALWIPDDGASTSSDACNALMKGAKQNGVDFFEKCGVKRVITSRGKVVGVETTKGYIECTNFVNAAGLWSRELGLRCDPKVSVPLHACEHFYIVTKPLEGVHDMLPVLRVHDARVYIREWSGGLLCGGFEAKAKPCFYDKIPSEFEFQLLPEDWPHFTENFLEGLIKRIPSIQNAEIRQFFNGPESFTSDGGFLCGESSEVKNYFVAAGMNSNGIVCGPGIGKAISDMIIRKKPSFNVSAHNIRRFTRDVNNNFFLKDRVKEVLGNHYSLSYPKLSLRAARPIKTSPLYDSLDAAGAQWSVVAGWERADWFDSNHEESRKTFGKPKWLKHVKNEYKACTNGIGFVDMSWQSIVQISGTNAALLVKDMQYIFANDIDIKVNSSVFSAILDHEGYYYGVVKLIRTSASSFLALLSPTEEVKFKTWLQTNLPNPSNANLKSLSGSISSIALIGKSSTSLLNTICHPNELIADIDQNCGKFLDVGYASDVLLLRGLFNNKNNWELLVPSQYMVGLRRLIFNKCQDIQIKDVGHYTFENIRGLNRIPTYGSELSSSLRPHDLGDKYYVDFDKPADFIGKQNPNANNGEDKILVSIQLPNVDENSWVWGGEPILKNGQQVGNIISAIWDFDGNRLTGLAFLCTSVKSCPLEVLVAGVKYSVSV